MSYQETNRVYAAKLSVPKHRVMLGLPIRRPWWQNVPSDATIAWMTDYSPKQVKRIKKACKEDQYLSRSPMRRHHKPAIYESHPEVAPQKVPLRVDTHMSTLDNEKWTPICLLSKMTAWTFRTPESGHLKPAEWTFQSPEWT